MIGERLGGGELHSAQRAVVGVVFHEVQRGDGRGVAREAAYAPAGHAEAFRQREELARHIGGAFDLKDARRDVAVVGVFAVGAVVADQHVIFPAKVDGALEEVQVRQSGGGIVGIVDPQQLGLSGDLGIDLVEVHEVAVFGAQRDIVRRRAGEDVADVVGRVARQRRDADVAGVQQAHGQLGDGVFGAHRHGELVVREVHAPARFVEVAAGLGEFGDRRVAAIAVAIGVGFVGCGALQFGDDFGRRGIVRVADAEGDHVDAFGAGVRNFLTKCREQVRRQRVETIGGRGVHERSFRAFVGARG